MPTTLRKLNETGIEEFSGWLSEGGRGEPPHYLLFDPRFSEPVAEIVVSTKVFANRNELGEYLRDLLNPVPVSEISDDRGLWTWLAILWFDQICPADAEGVRDIREMYRYILSKSYRHYYRHLIRTPWQIVRDHGSNGRFLLLSPRESEHPLKVSGEILEQFAGRQGVLRSRRIVSEASKLYTDPVTGRPKAGASGSGAGSARRLALVLQQFRLTYDIDNLGEGKLIELLPKEFNRWKRVSV